MDKYLQQRNVKYVTYNQARKSKTNSTNLDEVDLEILSTL